MKKSLSIFLCIMMIVMTFSSCKFIKSKDTDDKDSANTSESADKAENQKAEKGEKDGSDDSTKSGKTDGSEDVEDFTIYVTDKNGEYVTDKSGKKVTTNLDVEALGQQLEEQIENQSSSSKSNSSIGTGSISSSEEDLLPEGTKANNTTLMKTKVEPILKGGTYTIKGKIKVEGTSMDATIAFKNNSKDFSVSVSMMGFAVKAFSSNGKYYLAVPMLGKYAEVSKDEMGDMSEMTDAFKSSNAKYVKTTTVKDGKKTYTCEEYTAGTSTVKYYFNEKSEWKRLEVVEDDDILVWEIDSFTNKADDSLFAPTKGMKLDNSLFDSLS